MRKPRGKEWTIELISKLANLCQITPVDTAIVHEALAKHHKDFEDDIQYYSAVFSKLDAIVTGNPDDFPIDCLQILTPELLLEEFSNKKKLQFL